MTVKTAFLYCSISDTYEEIGKAEQALDEAKERCAALEAEVNESRKKQRRMALDKLNSGRSALRECSEKHDQALDELSSAKDELRKSRFGSVSPEEAEESVKEDLDELDALRAAVKKRNSPLLAVLFFLLAAAGAALYTVYSRIVYVIAAGVACVAAVFLIIRWARLRRGSLDADYRRREILKEYGAASAKDIRLAVDRHAELWDAVMDAAQHEYETRCAYEDALEAQQSYEAAALDELDFAGGSSDAARLSHELAQSRKEASAGNISGNTSSCWHCTQYSSTSFSTSAGAIGGCFFSSLVLLVFIWVGKPDDGFSRCRFSPSSGFSDNGDLPSSVFPDNGGASSSSPRMLMSRNLLYTAVTRAKRLVVVVGREACMRQMVDRRSLINDTISFSNPQSNSSREIGK